MLGRSGKMIIGNVLTGIGGNAEVWRFATILILLPNQPKYNTGGKTVCQGRIPQNPGPLTIFEH
jgi:hypothetical protein